jgi:Plavaka transposase
MERRPWLRRLNRQLPLRFRDELPQPPPSFPLENIPQPSTAPDPQHPSTSTSTSTEEGVCPSLAAQVQVGFPIRRIFTTPRNLFGLSRRFYGTDRPPDNPESEITLQDLSNISVPHNSLQLESAAFYPFPNRNAFLMGDWFWNGGVQKSIKSFRELMNILGDPEFKLEDVRDVNWGQVNDLLATDNEGEWVDDDAGWVHTPVTISVPYQPRRGVPSNSQAGPRNYVVDDFYYRSLVSVIREKISGMNAANRHLFHTEPYEMLWQTANHRQPVRVQGELYTSPSFVDAHRKLQDSPPEPGCNLPRAIVALMFWSDVTHLTSFGNAKLWPLYLFFGNESKYRRCKPSCHLCEHVAYFRSVSCYPDVCRLSVIFHLCNTSAIAPRLVQRLRYRTDGRWQSAKSSAHDSLLSRAFSCAMESPPR